MISSTSPKVINNELGDNNEVIESINKSNISSKLKSIILTLFATLALTNSVEAQQNFDNLSDYINSLNDSTILEGIDTIDINDPQSIQFRYIEGGVGTVLEDENGLVTNFPTSDGILFLPTSNTNGENGRSRYYVKHTAELGEAFVEAETSPVPGQSNAAISNYRILDEDAMALENQSLPIQVSRFEGEQNGKVVDLEIEVAAQLNSDYIEIVRSDENGNTLTIGTLTTEGTTDQTVIYNFTDTAPLDGTNYYQIINHDFDGTVQVISKIVPVNFEKGNDSVAEGIEADIDVISNVAGQGITLDYSGSEQAQVTIYTLAGQTLYTGPANGQFNSKELVASNGVQGAVIVSVYDKNSQKSFKTIH